MTQKTAPVFQYVFIRTVKPEGYKSIGYGSYGFPK